MDRLIRYQTEELQHCENSPVFLNHRVYLNGSDSYLSRPTYTCTHHHNIITILTLVHSINYFLADSSVVHTSSDAIASFAVFCRIPCELSIVFLRV